MDNASYVALTRQSALLSEMQVVANNIANISTAGYRKEGAIFAEMVKALPVEGGSISMTSARARVTDFRQGDMARTDGTFDLAIEGDGFFQVETAAGIRLTRAGVFARSAEGELVTPDGYRVLGDGGSPIFLPPDARMFEISADGTIAADGSPIGAIGLVRVENPESLTREGGVLFNTDETPQPAENAAIRQGFIEGGNVDPVSEMARMITIQRAYELGQRILDGEDERVKSVLRTLGQRA